MTADAGLGALKLRDYQRDAIAAVHRAWAGEQRGTGAGVANRVAVVLATGLGKTVIFAHPDFRRPILARRPGSRMLVLVHRDELAAQAVAKVHGIDPSTRVGRVQAQHDDVDAEVVVASVQTLARESRRERIRNVGLIVIDECFPSWMTVEVPGGAVPISQIRPGDDVLSWDDETGALVARPVVRVMRKAPSALVRLTLSDGRRVVCTPGHPILTDQGWLTAGQSHGALVLSFTHDADADLYGVLDGVCRGQEASDRHVAQGAARLLRRLMPRRLGRARQVCAHGGNEPQARFGANDQEQPDGARGVSRQDARDARAHRAQAELSRREREANSGAAAQTGRPAGMARRAGRRARGWLAALPLQVGHRTPDDEGLRRDRRWVSLLDGAPRLRRSQGRTPTGARVVDAQVLEPGGDGTYGGLCSDGLVYNLEVEGTHTYLVASGLVAHNCHHSVARSYVDTLRHFGAFDDVPTAGFSATLGRGDEGKLGDIFSEVVIERDIAWGIRGGHLVDVRGKRVQVQGLDLSAVKRVGGDLSAEGVASALDDAQAPEQVAKAYAEHAGDRQGVAFWPDVATAREGAVAMSTLGVPAAVVTGATSIDERADVFDRLRRGDLQVVTNCMVLTEGWDMPQVSCAAIVRPTQSAPLYTQMAGRVLRPHRGPAVPGFAPKRDALILDFVGVASRHKLATIADLSITTQVRRDELGDDVSLLDTIDEFERTDGDGAAAGTERPLLPSGPLVTTEVELFSESAMLWLQTRAGTWFIPAGPHLLFLWPEPGGLWTIGQAPTNAGPGNARPLASGMMLDLAMRHAEQRAAVLEAEAAQASASGARLSTRSASWRQGSRPATEAQLAYAARLGLSWPDERPTKATVSDAISVAKASFVLGG